MPNHTTLNHQQRRHPQRRAELLAEILGGTRAGALGALEVDRWRSEHATVRRARTHGHPLPGIGGIR